jgi:hypothetical protein
MKNFREEQINSTTEPCINQYWEKEVEENGVKITFHYWRRKEGYKGYWGEEGRISRVVGEKKVDDKIKKKRINSIWSIGLGEDYCKKQMLNKFEEI